MSFAITREPIDADGLREALEDDAAGAAVCFEGRVRNHSEGQVVRGLDYDAYDALAVREGERILAEVRARFDILRAACVHRAGSLGIGDCAVWVGVAAAHRAAAFDACRYIIDEVKLRVPVWKKEAFASGESGWVHGSDGGGPVSA
jgi:molybdopterin synthase catalytic subunit